MATLVGNGVIKRTDSQKLTRVQVFERASLRSGLAQMRGDCGIGPNRTLVLNKRQYLLSEDAAAVHRIMAMVVE